MVCWLHEWEKRILKSGMNILTLSVPLSTLALLSSDKTYFFLHPSKCWLTWFTHLLRILCASDCWMNGLKGERTLKCEWQSGDVIVFIVCGPAERWYGWKAHYYGSHKTHLFSHECEISSSPLNVTCFFSVLSHCLKLDDVTGRDVSTPVL